MVLNRSCKCIWSNTGTAILSWGRSYNVRAASAITGSYVQQQQPPGRATNVYYNALNFTACTDYCVAIGCVRMCFGFRHVFLWGPRISGHPKFAATGSVFPTKSLPKCFCSQASTPDPTGRAYTDRVLLDWGNTPHIVRFSWMPLASEFPASLAP